MNAWPYFILGGRRIVNGRNSPPLQSRDLLLPFVWLLYQPRGVNSFQRFYFGLWIHFCFLDIIALPVFLSTQLLFAKSMQELQLGVGASVGCFVERGLLSNMFSYSILMFICHFMIGKKEIY